MSNCGPRQCSCGATARQTQFCPVSAFVATAAALGGSVGGCPVHESTNPIECLVSRPRSPSQEDDGEMDSGLRGRVPQPSSDSIIIHFDYDCFYASVFEAENPALKSQALAVQQKQIIVTCNYEARRRGLHKLQLIQQARKICPDVVIVLGEDLTRFRNASKELYNFLRSFSWNGKVERLGLDEVFMDVTDIIDYNVDLLNHNDLRNSFFCLYLDDPTIGFRYDASQVAGHMFPELQSDAAALQQGLAIDPLQLRLNVGSHLAQHLRHLLEEQKGYTSTVGISTSKLLAKLVGNVKKPKAQTTLMTPYVCTADRKSNVTDFIDGHEIGKIPGIGFKLAQKLRDYVLNKPPGSFAGITFGDAKEHVSIRDVRLHPGVSPEVLERLLAGPGAPNGIGGKVWELIHGVDFTEVAQAREVPKQISIEDSYLRLDTQDVVLRELHMLAKSVINRMHFDLVEDIDPDDSSEGVTGPKKRWIAHPRTLRLSTRPRPPTNPDGTRSRAFQRISRSGPVPSFLFSLTTGVDALAERLVAEHLLPLFRKLHPQKSGWDLSLINIAVTNMVDAASESKDGSGRDILKMFKKQETVLKEWKVDVRHASSDDAGSSKEAAAHDARVPEPALSAQEKTMLPAPRSDSAPEHKGSEDLIPPSQESRWEDGEWDKDGAPVDETSLIACDTCGAMMPAFAMLAHMRFHALGD